MMPGSLFVLLGALAALVATLLLRSFLPGEGTARSGSPMSPDEFKRNAPYATDEDVALFRRAYHMGSGPEERILARRIYRALLARYPGNVAVSRNLNRLTD